MFESISVSTHTSDKYRYHVGMGLLDEACSFISNTFGNRKLIIIIDRNVHLHHISRIQEVFEPVFKKVLTYVVPPGEKSKSLDQLSSILDSVLKDGVERKTPILAIGGGVIGDLSGFVAASVLRGIPLIHMPTSLLAMVDSSIGGKTGINHSTGKNLIGAFYQPKAVFADIEFLDTLPEKEWVNGLSEIIKYGMIESPDILETLKSLTNEGKFARPKDWMNVIKQSAEIKINIVQRDVLEGGVRAYLNFGHTYGHVIEKAGKYVNFSHGEAVFAGMFGAVSASNESGHQMDIEHLNTFKSLYDIDLSNLPDIETLIKWMHHDKKVDQNEIRLILLKDLGNPFIQTVQDEELLTKSWSYLIQQFS
ncbi:MAG: 3-dehydroquinate synthase [Balneolaceae bacterium]